MTALEKIIKEKHDRLDSVPAAFETSIIKSQKQVLREVEQLLAGLAYDTDGNIIMNAANLAKVEIIGNKMAKVLSTGEYAKAVQTFIGEFPPQAVINNTYFEKAFTDFSDKAIYQKNITIAQENALLLINEDAVAQVLIQPLKNQLINSIATNSTYANAIDSMVEFITGNKDIEGNLLRYAKQNVFDAFSIFDRNYANVVAQDLKVEFYRYIGGKVKATRCFCDVRNGNYYHRKEVEGWGEGKGVGDCGFPWAGERKGTNAATIFSYAGGYNCRHSIMPVSEFAVDKPTIGRNIANGNYKPPK